MKNTEAKRNAQSFAIALEQWEGNAPALLHVHEVKVTPESCRPGGVFEKYPAGVFYQAVSSGQHLVFSVFAAQEAAEAFCTTWNAKNAPALVMTPPPAPRPANIKREKMPLQFELPVFFGLFEGE